MADNKVLDIIPTLRNRIVAMKLNATSEIAALHACIESMLKKYSPHLIMNEKLKNLIVRIGWQADDSGPVSYKAYSTLFGFILELMNEDENQTLKERVMNVAKKITDSGFKVLDSSPWWLPHYMCGDTVSCSYYVPIADGDAEMTTPFTLTDVDAKLEFSPEFLSEIQELRRDDGLKEKYAVYSLSRGQKSPTMLHASTEMDAKMATSILHGLYSVAFAGADKPDTVEPITPPEGLIDAIVERKEWEKFSGYANRAFCLPASGGSAFPIGFLKNQVFLYAIKV